MYFFPQLQGRWRHSKGPPSFSWQFSIRWMRWGWVQLHWAVWPCGLLDSDRQNYCGLLHETGYSPRRWALYAWHRLRRLRRCRLFCLSRTWRGLPVWRDNMMGHWKFRTWFLSSFICFPWGLMVLNMREYTFSEESRMIFRTDPKFIVKAVMPNLAHFVPIFDHSVLDGVF